MRFWPKRKEEEPVPIPPDQLFKRIPGTENMRSSVMEEMRTFVEANSRAVWAHSGRPVYDGYQQPPKPEPFEQEYFADPYPRGNHQRKQQKKWIESRLPKDCVNKYHVVQVDEKYVVVDVHRGSKKGYHYYPISGASEK